MARQPEPNLAALEERLGYRFRDTSLLRQAVTHRSSLGDGLDGRDNERLEFLGDAALELAVTLWLYRAGGEASEGRLTQLRSSLVSRRSLARCARTFGLGEFIRLGRGEASSGGASKVSIQANCMEALIGAIFLDGGFEATSSVVRRLFEEPLLRILHQEDVRDSKSILQEYSLRYLGILPRYELVEAQGHHHERTFRVRVIVGDSYRMTGTGKSKKAAEQDAAEKLLEIVRTETA